MRRRTRRSRKKSHTITNNSFEQFVENDLADKFKLWMLRVIIRLNGFSEFLDSYDNFRDENIAIFLGLEKYIHDNEINKDEILSCLKNDLETLENKKKLSTSKILKNNLKKISSMMNLNKTEMAVLEFTLLINQYDILQTVTDYLGNELNSNLTKKALSIILNIPKQDIDKCFTLNSKFSQSSIIKMYKKSTQSLDDKLEPISNNFADCMISSDEDIEHMIKNIVYKCDDTTLCLKDFNYLKDELKVLIPYLKQSIKKGTKGVNVLLYGKAGTGKTELSKAIAKKLSKSLYEVSYSDEDNEPIEGIKRLEAYKTAQALLCNNKNILMFDEVEDVLNSGGIFDRRQKNKAWINRVLENNSIPSIWITNNIYAIDNAVIRRFDMAIEIPIANKEKRENIIAQYSNDDLSSDVISKLASNEFIAPGLISQASKVVSSLQGSINKDKTFEMIVNNTLKAQGYGEIKDIKASLLPKSYDPSFINSNIDLNKLTKGIKKSQNARICLYGPAGTGKSAYGKFIAKKLDKPLILKKGSDLLSMYVGGSEKNIANAFKEAKELNAVLVFDEVDSFLADRSSANKNWEITQVNEMLVQMENFDGIFIATTNLMDNLDKASLRRFDLKLEFGFLKANQAWELFKSECKNLKIKISTDDIKNTISNMTLLTPGDFAAVIRQNKFNPIKDVNDFIDRLQDEIDVKDLNDNRKMGFFQ